MQEKHKYSMDEIMIAFCNHSKKKKINTEKEYREWLEEWYSMEAYLKENHEFRLLCEKGFKTI